MRCCSQYRSTPSISADKGYDSLRRRLTGSPAVRRIAVLCQGLSWPIIGLCPSMIEYCYEGGKLARWPVPGYSGSAGRLGADALALGPWAHSMTGATYLLPPFRAYNLGVLIIYRLSLACLLNI